MVIGLFTTNNGFKHKSQGIKGGGEGGSGGRGGRRVAGRTRVKTISYDSTQD